MKFPGLWICCFFFYSSLTRAEEDPVWQQKIPLPAIKGTTYEALNQIGEAAGLFFIYDSQLIDNDRKVKLDAGNYTLKDAIRTVTRDEKLQIRLIGKHILLYKLSPVSPEKEEKTKEDLLIIEGTVRDKITREVLSHSSISLSESGIGSIANSDGKFQLKIPDSLRSESVCISCMGYQPQILPLSLFEEGNTDIYLNIQVIPIPEVIVHLINPRKIIHDMLEKRKSNYQDKPVVLTTFYREGVARKKGIVNLTEAVFKIYKQPYHSNYSDQVKLLKMRRITNYSESDSIVLRIKAGIESSLLLDLVKNLPDFLTPEDENLYNFSKIDVSTIDSHLAHVIAFEQKPEINTPLFRGELYIDAENSALLNARFEFNPRYIRKIKEDFVVKRSRNLDIEPRSAVYSVSYKEWNGKYYLNHIRGELEFEIKKKKRFLQRTNTLTIRFEMATCQIDTILVKPFPGKERIPVHKIFSETNFSYDPDFWKDFNIILPEENLSEALSRIAAKIEELIDE